MSQNRLSRAITTLGIGVLLLFRVWIPAVGASPGPLTDQMISDAVADEIHHDAAILSPYVDVQTEDGIVMLSGIVNNLVAKKQATRIAEMVKGVRAVVNELYIQPTPSLTDEAILKGIQTALILSPAVEAPEVDVRLQNGVATLSGTVQSWQEKETVRRVAEGVKGVVGVENRIQVQPPESRPDREIQEDIEQNLRWDARVDHALIDVEVQNGNVRLTGIVGSAAEKRMAMTNVAVVGITGIDVSGLKVEKWARDPALRENKYVVKSDEDIRQAVSRALQINPWVRAARITPVVRDGKIILRGAVSNLKAKREAAQVARHTVGVRQVTNRIKVRTPEEMRNEALTANIRGALTRDPYVSRYTITVDVENGTAFLNGAVSSYFEKAQAEEVAGSIRGIASVQNHLRVLNPSRPLVYNPFVYEDWSVVDYPWYDYAPGTTWIPDADIQQDIEREIWWSPFVDSDDVSVAVSNGVATLTGMVESWSERRAASENAYEGGARRVVNQIQVGSSSAL
jgi:osmotically-inducible protein OsmY